MISFYYRNVRLRYPSLKKFPGPGGDPPTPTICKYCVAARHNTCRWGFSGKNTCRPHLFYLQRLFGGLATDPRLLAKYLPGASRKCKHCSPVHIFVAPLPILATGYNRSSAKRSVRASAVCRWRGLGCSGTVCLYM